MNGWQRWWQAPHTHWLHRALFQVHLWLGIGFGLYVLVISVSGSAIVLRPWIHRWLVQDPAAANAPWPVRTVEWLTLLHDELLLDRSGRTLNGVGGLVFLLLVFSGAVLWWQGRRRWHEGLRISTGSARPLLWQLHSFLGFWAFLLFFAWGLTAVYFAWPLPFDLLMDHFDADLFDAERPDGWLLFLIDLHFGRFRGTLLAACLWTVLGLLPAFMYVSGFVLWYRRVLQRRLAPAAVSGQRVPPVP